MCPIEKFPESELAKISFILSPSLEFPNYSFEKTESCAALCRGKTSKIISFQIDKRGKVILIPSSLKPIVQKNHHRPKKNLLKLGLLYIAAGTLWGVWVSVCGYLALPGWYSRCCWCRTIQTVCGRTIGKLPTIITLAHLLLFDNNN